MLLQDGAIVTVYNPKVKKEDALSESRDHDIQVAASRFIFADTAQQAVDEVHALVVLTTWDERKMYP